MKIDSVSIQFNDDDKLYKQIYEWFVTRITNGEFNEENNKLPPIRKLADYLGVNTVTVVNAYKLLEQKGFVISKKGSGVYVSQKFISSISDEYLYKKKLINNQADYDLITSKIINFSSAIPTPAAISMEDMKEVINQIFERDKGYAFGYDETSGFLPLRKTISKILKENYNIEVFYELIQIISGAQQGIDIISKALLKHGDTVFVENPTYTGAIAVFKSRGVNIVGIPMNDNGIDIDKLRNRLKLYSPKLIYTMPNYHNPTTICYSKNVKQELLKLSKAYGFYIIEDDTLSDLHYNESRNISTLKSIDEYNRVIYIKSFSKILMPGLRLGFTVSPPEVFENITHAKYITDLYSSGLIQRAFDLYIRKGNWKEHINQIKDIYKSKYNILIEEMKKLRELGVDYKKPDGGLYLWIKIPQSVSSIELVKLCKQRGVSIISGNVFYLKDKEENDHFIRLCYSDVSAEEIQEGINKIYKCLKSLKKGEIINKKIFNSFY